MPEAVQAQQVVGILLGEDKWFRTKRRCGRKDAGDEDETTTTDATATDDDGNHGWRGGRRSVRVHPTDDYDFIIKLDRSVIPRYFQNVTADSNLLARRGKYANSVLSSSQDPVRPGFDPVQNCLFRIHRYVIVIELVQSSRPQTSHFIAYICGYIHAILRCVWRG